MVYRNADYAKVLKNGSNQNTIKNSNRSLVLEVLNLMGSVSRTQLAKVTGLTKTSITNITADLLNNKIIDEISSDKTDGAVGRKPISLEISKQSPCAIGISINRDFIYASLVNLRGELLMENSYVHGRKENAQSLIAGIFSCCDDILKYAEQKDILGIGVASIGPLDIKKGMILEPPNFKGIKNIKIVDILKEKYNLPVRLNNDMCGGAIAEKLFGYGKQYLNFIYVGVTNGIGAGVVLNNKIYTGENGFAGEIGHISIDYDGKQCPCGNQGCLELYAGIPYIIEDTKEMLKGVGNSLLSNNIDNLRWLDIVDAANKGDRIACKAIKKAAHYLAMSFVSLANIYDPQIIFLGHEIASAEIIIDEIQQEINKKIFSKGIARLKVQLSKFTDIAYKVNGAAILIGDYFAGDL